MVAIGDAITAISRSDQTYLDQALSELLDAHRNKVVRGELRGLPEGYVSLPSMCLARIALMRGLLIKVESEYLPLGYLGYLSKATSG